MKTTIALATLATLTLTAAACGKKKDDAAGSSAKPAEGGGKAAAPAKLSYKKVGATGLEAEVPDDANVDDNSASAGFPSATIWATPTTFLTGAFSGDDWGMIKATFEESKTGIEKDAAMVGKLKGFTKEEKTADGWQFEWEATSMTDSPVFGIQIRLVIDGKAWDCGTNAGSPAERETAIKICKSVRKAS
ncbi:MAG: hypothetical protein IPL61_08760 [Myxococcales bacterium]|nr:hypothetical protein [Myxococcales bacterium]